MAHNVLKRPNQSVIFDCDGTIMKSLILGLGAYNYALERVGARPHEPHEIKQFFGTGADRIFMKLLNGDEKKSLEAYEYYYEYEAKQVHKIIPHEGIIDLLDNLKNAGIRMGVVTGRHFRELELMFNHHNLFPYFDSIVCDNHLENSKPHPEGILLAMKQLNVRPEETSYVGDAVMDMVLSNSSGVKPIAALWDDWAKKDEMEKERPALMAETPADIWKWLSSQPSP